MTEFEDALKKALARQQPSPDFTARIMDQVSGRKKPPLRHWAAIAAAATVLLALSGAYQQHQYQHEHQLQGQAAKEKLLVALQIAGSKLHTAQERVQEIESTQVNQ